MSTLVKGYLQAQAVVDYLEYQLQDDDKLWRVYISMYQNGREQGFTIGFLADEAGKQLLPRGDAFNYFYVAEHRNSDDIRIVAGRYLDWRIEVDTHEDDWKYASWVVPFGHPAEAVAIMLTNAGRPCDEVLAEGRAKRMPRAGVAN